MEPPAEILKILGEPLLQVPNGSPSQGQKEDIKLQKVIARFVASLSAHKKFHTAQANPREGVPADSPPPVPFWRPVVGSPGLEA